MVTTVLLEALNSVLSSTSYWQPQDPLPGTSVGVGVAEVVVAADVVVVVFVVGMIIMVDAGNVVEVAKGVLEEV